GFDSLDGRAARGAYVVHNDDFRAFFLKAFNAAAHAMAFLRFAHQKSVDRRCHLRADDSNGNNQRVRTQCEPAHRLWTPTLPAKQVEENAPGKLGPLRVQGGTPAVDVVVAPGSRRECEFAQPEGVPGQQAQELFANGLAHKTETA